MAAKRAKRLTTKTEPVKRFTTTSQGAKRGKAVLDDVQNTNAHFRDMKTTWRKWEAWLVKEKIKINDIDAASLYDYLLDCVSTSKKAVKGSRVDRWRHHLQVINEDLRLNVRLKGQCSIASYA